MQNVSFLLGRLKEDVEFDGTAVNHMHLALYIFQDAVRHIFFIINEYYHKISSSNLSYFNLAILKP